MLISAGLGFKSRPLHCPVQPSASYLHTHVHLSSSNIIASSHWWRCLMAGKVTVGLASHWARVTCINGSPPTGLKA